MKSLPFTLMKLLQLTTVAAVAGMLITGCQTAPKDRAAEEKAAGFVSLFNGTDLTGWTLLGKKGDGYGVTNGVIFCSQGGGGNLLSEKQYANFVLRFEFRLHPKSNNGIAIRAPFAAGSIAYDGMEIQVLDLAYDKPLRPEQYHGSIYDVFPAKTGYLKPAGFWNEQEIIADGRRIIVKLNGLTIVDADLNTVTDPAKIAKHPGLFRERGHVGFLGHNDYCEFKNIRIKELPDTRRIGDVLANDNVAPSGFSALFDGRTLNGWKGQLARPNDNPINRAKLSPEKLAAEQAKANTLMAETWKLEDRAVVYRGTGYNNLVTTREFGNFEFFCDWKIEEQGDSGVYLRGVPQVQIWDTLATNRNAVGSGGLFNNKKARSTPLHRADRLTGEWNRFQILMYGDRCHIFLNDELVVKDTPLENYWQTNAPLPATGPIELQAHNSPVWFKNLYVRELPAAPAKAK